ncbi:type II secretion system protein GspD [Pseudothermotoga sp. U03pept]|uniref:type II secretion system protein GspD n=1 Tax=Pseudothermotoga sp. U03pept TaxID=3447012 RepID=UPI003F104628
MKKILVFLLLVLTVVLLGAEIRAIVPSFEKGRVSFKIETDAVLDKNNLFVEKNAAGSLVSVHLKDVALTNSPFFLPVAYGPVDSLRGIGTYQGSLIIFQLLVPTQPEIEIVGKVLKVTFKSSEKLVDLVLTDISNLETAVKFLAEELKMNVVVSDSVKTIKLSLKLSQITPEEALRNILLTVKVGSEPLAYSYMPDGTLHIGTKSEISSRFAQFWGIYDVKDQELVERLQKVLSPTTVMTYLPNKAVLFVYGDIYEQELIARILSIAPPSVTREITVSAPTEDVTKLLESLKKVYKFDFNLLEGLNKYIIVGDSKTIQTVLSYVNQLEERFRKSEAEKVHQPTDLQPQPQILSKQFTVIYPEEAAEILKISGYEVLVMPFGVLEVAGSEFQLQIAERILQDFGFLEKAEIDSLSVPKVVRNQLRALLSELFGIPESRFVETEDGLLIIAPSQVRENVRSVAAQLIQYLYSLEYSEVFFLSDEETASQVSEIISKIYGIETISVQNVLKATGTDEELSKVKNFLRTFVKDRLVRTIDVKGFTDEVYSEVKTLIESRFAVRIEANLKSLDMILMSSYDKQDLEEAIGEIKRLNALIASKAFVRLVPVIVNLPLEDTKLILLKMFGVDLEETAVFYVLSGEKEKVIEAERFLEDQIKPLIGKENYALILLPEYMDMQNLSSILETLTSVKVYTINQLMILQGTKERIESAQKLIDEIQQRVKVPSGEVYSLVLLPEYMDMQNLSSILETLTSVKVYTIGRLMILHGIKEAVERAEDFIMQVQEKIPEPTKPTLIVQIHQYVEEIATDQFQSFLESIGIPVKLDVYEKLGVVVFSGKPEDVEKAVSKYEEFSEKLRQEAELSILQAQPIKVEKNQDGTISIKCSDASLMEVISIAAENFGVSLAFVNYPTETITMNVSSISWNQLKRLVEEQYGYSFVEAENVTAFVKPKPVPDTTKEEKFIYTIPHNLDNAKSLVEFYGGKVHLDNIRNLMVVTGLTKEAREELEKLMQEVSKPLEQVEIEARLVDRSLIDELERSLSFKIDLPGPANPELSLSGSELNITTSVISLFDYQRFLSFLPNASITISSKASDSKNLDNLLASPRIVTSSGREARILIGDRIPYQTVDAEGNVTVNFLDTGIELKITPFVTSDGTIELLVYTKVSKPTYYPNINIPGESTREANTHVVIKNGETLVIGGLIREVKEHSESKVPILGDLPFIGQLFRTKTEKADKRELVIFITARVIER